MTSLQSWLNKLEKLKMNQILFYYITILKVLLIRLINEKAKNLFTPPPKKKTRQKLFLKKEGKHLYNILQHNYGAALGKGDFIL